MTHTTSSAGGVPTLRGGVLTDNVIRNSAFLRALRPANIPAEGVAVHRFKPANLTPTAEAALKNVTSGSVTKVEVYAQKLANIDTFSDELLDSLPELQRILTEESVAPVGRSIDVLVAGAGTSVMSGLGSAQGFDTTTISGVQNAVGAVVSAGWKPTGVVLSTTAYLNLFWLAQNTNNGNNVLKTLTGDFANPGFILGMPVYVFDSADPNAAFIGDFQNAAFGGIRNGYPTVDITTEATLVDPVTEDVIPLWQQNLVGVQVETYAAFKVAELAAFARLETEPGEEDEDEEEDDENEG